MKVAGNSKPLVANISNGWAGPCSRIQLRSFTSRVLRSGSELPWNSGFRSCEKFREFWMERDALCTDFADRCKSCKLARPLGYKSSVEYVSARIFFIPGNAWGVWRWGDVRTMNGLQVNSALLHQCVAQYVSSLCFCSIVVLLNKIQYTYWLDRLLITTV